MSRVAHLSHEPFYQTGAPKHDIRPPGQIARLIGGEGDGARVTASHQMASRVSSRVADCESVCACAQLPLLNTRTDVTRRLDCVTRVTTRMHGMT